MMLKRSSGPERMSNRRRGFTLIELLLVIVILGILAMIGLRRFWAAKERSYWAGVRSDLHSVALAQETYYEKALTYADVVTALPEVTLSPGVTVTITYFANDGWAGTAGHASLSPKKCGYFTGGAPAGSAPPATVPGQITCDE